MRKMKKGHVRCYWTGKMQLSNGEIFPMHCIQISRDTIEVETPTGLKGCRRGLLVINAINNNLTKQLKIICTPTTDILNEFDKHYIFFTFDKMSEDSREFIEEYLRTAT